MDEKSYSSAGVSRSPLDDQTAQELKADFTHSKPPKIQINSVLAACLLLLMLAMVIAIAALGVTERNRDVLQELATSTQLAIASAVP